MKVYLLGITLVLNSLTISAQSPFFHADTACIQGVIKNISNFKEETTGRITLVNAITGSAYPITLPILSDGSFKCLLPIKYPISSYIEIGKNVIPFYVCPLDTLFITTELDPQVSIPEIRYDGKGVRINRELRQANLAVKPVRIPCPEERNDSVRLDYGKKRIEAYRQYCRELSAYASSHSLMPSTIKLLRDDALMLCADDLLGYEMCYLNPEAKTVDPSTDPYYAFIKEINWNDSTLLSTHYFDSFIRNFDVPYTVYKKWQLIKGPSVFFRSLERMGHHFTKEEQELKSYFEQIKLDDPSYAQKQTEFQNLEDAHRENSLVGLAEQLVVRKILLQQDWKLSGFIYEITNVRLQTKGLCFASDRTQALQRLQMLLPEINHPSLIRECREATEAAFPEKQTDFAVPVGKASEIFQKLTKDLKGKVILIDIWATWCSPCIEGISALRPIREKYSKAGVAFVFVTSEKNAPIAAYRKIMDHTEGIKYRLAQNEYNYLCELFKINTIPHYILVDRNGKIINPNYRLQNLEKTLEHLLTH